MQTYVLDIRARRQTTLPKELLNKLNLSVGDSVRAYIENKRLVLEPQKQVALDAFRALQIAVKESGVSEKDMQTNVRKIRRHLNEKRTQGLR